jgi:hypothetical protein
VLDAESPRAKAWNERLDPYPDRSTTRPSPMGLHDGSDCPALLHQAAHRQVPLAVAAIEEHAARRSTAAEVKIKYQFSTKQIYK